MTTHLSPPSVVVISFSSRDLLKPCLDALGAIPIPETIVVDNASTDGSADLVRTQFPHVHLIENQTNVGFGVAANQGVKACHGRFAMILNPDCILEPGTLDSLSALVEAEPHLGAVGPRLINMDGSLQQSIKKLPSPLNFLTSLFGFANWVNTHQLGFSGAVTQPTDVEVVSGAAMLVRRDAWEEIGGMDEGFFLYFEDLDICRRLRRIGWRIVYHPHARARHQWGASTTQFHEISHPAFVSAAVRYYHKHYGPLAGVVIQAVLLLRELVHLTISLTHPFQANWGAHIRAAKNALAFPTALK